MLIMDQGTSIYVHTHYTIDVSHNMWGNEVLGEGLLRQNPIFSTLNKMFVTDLAREPPFNNSWRENSHDLQ